MHSPSTTERGSLSRSTPAAARLRAGLPAWLTAALIAGLALAPRTLGLADFFTIDEPYHWIARIKLFAAALSARDWAATDITGHPGVTTMWLGALGRWLGARLGVRDLGGVGAGAAYLATLRLPLAVTNSLAVAAGYLALRRLVRPRAALLAAILWATSPFLVAHGRLLHLDALLTSFMTLSVLLLLIATGERTENREPRAAARRSALGSWFLALVGSGVCAGLALLTKAPSLFLLPFAGLVLFFMAPDEGRAMKDEGAQPDLAVRLSSSVFARMRAAILPYLAWLGVAALTAALLWPALWVTPLSAIGDVANEIIGNGGEPEPAGNFFQGQAVAAPNWLFYPAVLVLRTTPITLAGLALLALRVPRRAADDRGTAGETKEQRGKETRRQGYKETESPIISLSPSLLVSQKTTDQLSSEQRTIVALLAFALLFMLMMTIEPKKFDRYLLPIWPALEILAAVGIETGLAWIIAARKRRTKNQEPRTGTSPNSVLGSWFSVLGWLTVSIALVANLAYFHPYYLAYYNPLVGGGATAQRTILVGWGEGLDQIGAWLRARPDLKRGPVLSWIPPTLMPFIPASPGVLDLRVPLLSKPSSYAVLYSRSVQRKESAVAEAYVRQNPPLYTLRMHGIEYASVYQLPRPFDTPLAAEFGDRLRLLGFSQARAGATLTITPSWDVRADQPGGQFCFVHVLAPDGRKVAQIDAPLDQGMFPSWQAGQKFDTPLPLQLPPSLVPGEYRVVLGVYPPGGARQPLRSGPAAPAELDGPDALLLATLRLP
jgi:4-amino-4-deoxy-L-arabinose transferase-like glycosyltransferase